MPSHSGVRALLALGLSVVAGLLCLFTTYDLQLTLLISLCSVIAVAIALSGTEQHPTPALGTEPQESNQEPEISEVFEAIAAPVLLVQNNHVLVANSRARNLLGSHIVGEDVRLAIRHPAAAELLTNPDKRPPARPVHLVGLGTREQRWEMRLHTLPAGQRVVQLINRTGSYAAERMRVDFVANASHELRTPLASLLGFVETLRDDPEAEVETRERFLKIMHDEATRMQNLVNDLLSLSRIEAEKYRAPNESVRFNDLVQQVCNEITASGAPRAEALSISLDETAPVLGDRAQLSQVLHNIITNAMKYGRDGTPVTVTLRQQGEMARLVVSDEGDGIPPQHLPRLTERFYRVDDGRSRKMGGTGLGLAIVKHVVERHRGKLDIASTLGVGTNVTISLPVIKS